MPTPELVEEQAPGSRTAARRATRRARAGIEYLLPAEPGALPQHLAGRPARRLVRRIRIQLLLSLAVTNVVGAVIVIIGITWVLPGTPSDLLTARVVVTNAVLGTAFLLLVIPAAVIWGEAWLRSGRRWLQEGRPPTEREVTAVLRAPVQLFLVHATAWMVAAVLFSIVNSLILVDLLPRTAFTITLAGLTVSAFAYLLTERLTRPLAVAALSMSEVARPRLPGVVTRAVLAWTLGTAIPLLGIAITAIFALVERDATATELAVTMLSLSGVGLVIGWWVTMLGARAVADPVASLRKGIRGLAEGDLTTRVVVSDGSVLGLLQAGFNDMAAGLEERERLRDLYSRQVGQDVADGALDRGFELGGELCEVAVLFVDVVGSTAMADALPPQEVVARLNRFFGVVVDEVHRRGGWINKFQGDATLAVFGAPHALDDAPGQALATARAVARRLPIEVPELGAGIGVSFGSVVAGHVGDERRFEFTVIGDPVNEAARLTELAKQHRPMVLASAAAVAAAAAVEGVRWGPAGDAELRGRSEPTQLMRPTS